MYIYSEYVPPPWRRRTRRRRREPTAKAFAVSGVGLAYTCALNTAHMGVPKPLRLSLTDLALQSWRCRLHIL